MNVPKSHDRKTQRSVSGAVGGCTSGGSALPLLDPLFERRLNLPRLERLITKRVNAVIFALGPAQTLWHELDHALTAYRERREQAYFELGRRAQQNDRSP